MIEILNGGGKELRAAVDLIIRCASTGRFFYLAWNDARNHVRNEQTFLEYLVPTAVEKIWETPSLGKKRGGGGSEGWGGYRAIRG